MSIRSVLLIHTLSAFAVLALLATPSLNAQVMSTSSPTINLYTFNSFYTPMTVAYHPGYDRYYANMGISSTADAMVYDSAGITQQVDWIHVEAMSLYYNPNTGELECATWWAINGGANRGLMQVDLSFTGWYTGTSSTLLSSVPGLHSSQSMPSYNSVDDVLYTHTDTASNGMVVRVASRQTGQLLNTITLTGQTLTGQTLSSWVANWIGFDDERQVFIHWDHADRMARVFDITGQYVGSCYIPNVQTPKTNYGVSYANGQLFVYDLSESRWEGHRIFELADMEVQRPQGNVIDHETDDNIAQPLPAGTPTTLTYTIENIGAGQLELTGMPLIQFANEVNASVSLQQAPLDTLNPSDTTTFEIAVEAYVGGPVSFDILIPCNVIQMNPYRITVHATARAPAPHIHVTRATSPVWPGHVDKVGGVSGGTFSVTYTIENVGDANMSIAGVTLSNEANVTANLATQPVVLVSPSGTTTFTLDLTASAAGPFRVDVEIATDAPLPESYPFRLSGTLQSPSHSVWRLERIPSVPLPDGDTDTLGTLVSATPSTYHWFVHNDGAATLSIFSATIANEDNVAVTVDAFPSEVSANDSAPLSLTVTAVGDGPLAFDLVLASNDAIHSSFVLHVEAQAVNGATPHAEVAVWRGGHAVTSGTAEALGVAAAGAEFFLAYQIVSQGPDPLDITLPVGISTNNCEVTVLHEPGTMLDALGGSDVLLLHVAVVTDSPASFDVNLGNSSVNANPFVIVGEFLTPAPRLEVRYPEHHSISNGASHHLGLSSEGTRVMTLVLANTGDAPLTLSDEPTLSKIDSTQASIEAPSDMTIQPGETATIEITIVPLRGVAFRFDLTVESNDAFGSPYIITFTGMRTHGSSSGGCATTSLTGTDAGVLPVWWMLAALLLLAVTGRTQRRRPE